MLALVNALDLSATANYKEKAFNYKKPVSAAFKGNISGNNKLIADVDKPNCSPSPTRNSPFILIKLRLKEKLNASNIFTLFEYK